MAKKFSKKELRQLRTYNRLKNDVFECLRGYHRRESGVVGVSGPDGSEYDTRERYYADLEYEVFYYRPPNMPIMKTSSRAAGPWEGGPYGYVVELTKEHLQSILASP